MVRVAGLVVLVLSAGLIVAGCGSSKSSAAAGANVTGTPVAVSSTTTATTTTTTRPGHKRVLPLTGKVVGIDPGHNGRNYTDPSYLNHLIWNGREEEGCDTTGTETDTGYTEAQFNWSVARYLQSDLKAEGASVVLTRHSNDGIGPCVNTRSEIINRAHANVAIDIHADGGPADGRGAAVLLPVADGPNDHVIAASKRFGRVLLSRYRALTGMPDSTYDGVDGFEPRDDLAGLNLTKVPKVLIECGNMRNATDAALLVKPSYQRLTAKAFAQAITVFLTGRR
jgi:N-acetylmuramoyl-L-alanine amidase